MDESQSIYLIKNQVHKITFHDTPLSTINGHSYENCSEDFDKYLSIDDDDIIVLDSIQEINYDVKKLLNHLIEKIINEENSSSQINNLPTKRALNEDECLLTKKVRLNICNEDNSPSLNCLFVSELFPSTDQLKPYTRFLYNLGYDLCLEYNHDDKNSLTQIQQQTLIKHNEIFHSYQIYSCKYCSFKTNTIHVINHHYRTPHTLSNSIDHHKKYRCTYCSFQTFRLPELRRHFEKKHSLTLITESSIRRYRCTFCSYESDDKNNFLKHNNRCEIEQIKTRDENNLLAPYDPSTKQPEKQFRSIQPKPTQNSSNTKKSLAHLTSPLNTKKLLNNTQFIESILIESDHDISILSKSSSSSDEDFIVSSDEESSSTTDDDTGNDRDFEILSSRPKQSLQIPSKSSTSLVSSSLPITPMAPPTTTTLSSLSKLLLLNGTPMSSTLNSNKSPLVPIQPKPTAGNDIYQMCNICQCYIYKKDYLQHMNDKHSNNSLIQSQPITILNTDMNTSITCLTPTLIVSQVTPPTIFLLSTMDSQSIILNMIKCPWCDTNFEHIDIMTGHLMRYHRMTLAAAKVVVAEQMKIQNTSSSQLSLMFKKEIEQIQKEFADKIYWKISQPKVYLHQIENFSCFVCHTNIDDIEKHFLSIHKIQLETLNKIKQCCLCGFQCDKNNQNLFEHQLRTHSGVCYSVTLKQFIRFEPPPPPLSRITVMKDNNRTILSSVVPQKRTLTTITEKKFGCRKCDTSSHLFAFDELVEHLRSKHNLNVKLHRRCIICQETYPKGKEYNQHCLRHLNEEYVSIGIKRYFKK